MGAVLEGCGPAKIELVFILDPKCEELFRRSIIAKRSAMEEAISADENDNSWGDTDVIKLDSQVLQVKFSNGVHYIVKVIELGAESSTPALLQTLAARPWPINIVEYLGVFDCNSHRYVIIKFCRAGDLLRSDFCFSEDGLRCIMRGALTGLWEMHDSQRVHCDIKSDNLLCSEPNLDAYGEPVALDQQQLLSSAIKVADISEATVFREKRGDVGTERAPEIWEEICEYIRNDSTKSWRRRAWTLEMMDETDEFDNLCPAGAPEDLWALGACLYDLVEKDDLFESEKIREIVVGGDVESLRHYYNDRIMFVPELFRSKGLSEGAIDFICRLLVVDTGLRATAQEALGHPWLQESSASLTLAAKFAQIFIRDPKCEDLFRKSLAAAYSEIGPAMNTEQNHSSSHGPELADVERDGLHVKFINGEFHNVKRVQIEEEYHSTACPLQLLATGSWPINILSHHAVYDWDGCRFLICEPCPAGSFGKKDVIFSEAGLKCIMRGALKGLCRLHECQWVHCNVKACNLLCSAQDLHAYGAPQILASDEDQLTSSIKLANIMQGAEFGTKSGNYRGAVEAKLAPEFSRKVCEQIRGGADKNSTPMMWDELVADICLESGASDLWAMGVCLYELVMKTNLFDINKILDYSLRGDIDALQQYYLERLALISNHFCAKNLSDAAAEFIGRLLVDDPDTRINAPEALAHSWLTEVGV